MSSLLGLSRLIDLINSWVGKFTMWLILAATLISAGNAVVRKTFNWSSNAMLEIQWYLFAGVFMLGAGYCLLQNAHVRIDFVSSRLTARMRSWIDIVGIVLVMFPLCLLIMRLSWPMFTQALASGEMSSNAGGLIRWPVFALIPAGFALLLLQSVSELIKRIAFLQGLGPDQLSHAVHKSDDEKLMEELAAQVAAETAAAETARKGA
jgi:TRAP-type mannitol/chloroaromatic compound transport system permease small subunit